MAKVFKGGMNKLRLFVSEFYSSITLIPPKYYKQNNEPTEVFSLISFAQITC